MKISFIIPSRDNLKYLKWAYASIRKNQGHHTVQICVADDASSDGTREWLQDQSASDSDLSYIVNYTGKRVGHTILYDRLVNDIAIHDLCIIWHADMYLCPSALDAIEKHMYTVIDNGDNGERWKNEKTIVSLTRIEPPLHPDGPEKILADFGTEPEDFQEEKFLEWFHNTGFETHYVFEHEEESVRNSGTTEGIFAPWAFWKEDFQEIGGHDPLYRPQSKEDSDIFNRFHLNGIKFIQTWEGFTYHLTSRGSRFNPTITEVGTNSDEWNTQNLKSARNFIRKWGHFVRHDRFMKPIVPPKYNVGIVIKGCTPQLLYDLEPWCDDIYVDLTGDEVDNYKHSEQPNTDYDLERRVHGIDGDIDNDVIIEFSAHTISSDPMNSIQLITHLPDILEEHEGGEGEFMIGILKITIKNLHTYEKELIVNKRKL